MRRALDGREAGRRLAVVPRRLVDPLEGREAVEDLRRGRRVDARAVEDAGPVYNRLIDSTPPTRTSLGEPDPLIDCHAANGRLQDVRGAPRTRGEPRRRDEEVEDVGARGEARRADEQLPKGLQLVGTQGPPAYRRQDRRLPEGQRSITYCTDVG